MVILFTVELMTVFLSLHRTNIVMNYTDIESKVREATNDEQWGPTGIQMQEISQHTFSYESFPEVMNMLWRRMLQDSRSNWRRTYKSLLLLQYLVRNGSERVVTSAREHIFDLRSLENYTYVDEVGKDQGVNVRNRARQIIDFIQDDEKLREERKKAKKNKDKYIGVDAHSMIGSSMRSSSIGGYGGSAVSGGSGGYSDSWEANESTYDENAREPSPIDNRATRESPSRSSPSANNNSPVPQSPVPRVVPPVPAPLKTGTRKTIKIDSSKKVDLGAAANYKGSPTTTSVSTVPTSGSDLIGDLLSIDVTPSLPTPVSALDDFASFESALPTAAAAVACNNIPPPPLGNTNSSVSLNNADDEFADFTSAFASTAPTAAAAVTPQAPPVQPLFTGGQKSPIDDIFGECDVFTASPLPVNNFPLNTLQPIAAATTVSSTGNRSLENNDTSSSATGSTWANLASTVNISVDNLLGSKYETKSAPSMNQLAAIKSTARVAPTASSPAQAAFCSAKSTNTLDFF